MDFSFIIENKLYVFQTNNLCPLLTFFNTFICSQIKFSVLFSCTL